MSIFNQFETDTQKEIEGVRVTYGKNKDGSEIAFYICRMGNSNKKYQKALDAATKPHRRQAQLGTLDNALAESLMMGVFVKTVLKGWENVQRKNGEEIPFSEQAAIELMTMLPDLYEDLQAKASGAAIFREEALEDEAKN